MDATYKLLDLRMPVYLIMCIDGDGLSEIAAMFLLAEETNEVVTSAIEIFKKANPSWSKTKVVLSDKDFTERTSWCFVEHLPLPHITLILTRNHVRKDGYNFCPKTASSRNPIPNSALHISKSL